MDIRIVCSLISFAGVVLSTLLNRVSTRKQVKKMLLEWEREDKVSLKDEVSAAVAAALQFAQSNKMHDQREAIGKIGSAMIQAEGDLINKLTALYDAVKNSNFGQISKYAQDIAHQPIGESNSSKR